jgi:hypothetical protein
MKLRVTLTYSENGFLQYPCEGQLEIFEVGTNDRIIVAVFRKQEPDGRLSCPVGVRNPEFKYK